MLKRTVYLSSPWKVSLKDGQLVLNGIEANVSEEIRVPIEDIGYVIVDNQQVHITLPLLNLLMEYNVGVVICDNKGMPKGMLNPLDSNTLQGERHRVQLEASAPAKKSIWQQLITAKIKNQSEVLETLGLDGSILKPHYRNVKSGDSDNREGAAARIYWKKLFGPGFIRSRDGFPPNNLLNYGYAILRAATARSIIGAGLLPSIGIHHHHRSNAFPLADDFMEPFRPIIDYTVYRLTNDGVSSLDKETKASLINILYTDTEVNGKLHPLNISLEMLCTSALKAMAGDVNKISVPKFIK